ncbi:hypothetical protein LQZ19_02600, partial [Treponema primitia]
METNLKNLIEKVKKLKNKDINEAQTKDWLIRPFFELLGWDFSDPDEVVPEDTDVSGKRPDYTFKIDNISRILIEAKSIGNQLDDKKMINEKMNYCANAQVPFLIITNGCLYNIYYAKLDGPNTEKLLFDFQLNDDLDEEIINRLKKESVKNDELSGFAKQTFILTNLKKTLEALFQEPQKKMINLINEKMKEIIGYTFGDADIISSLPHFNIQINSDNYDLQCDLDSTDSKSDQKQYSINEHFNNGKWDNSLNLYKSFIKKIEDEGIAFEQNPTKLYIGLISKGTNKPICQIHGLKKGLKILINIKTNELTEQEKLQVR